VSRCGQAWWTELPGERDRRNLAQTQAIASARVHTRVASHPARLAVFGFAAEFKDIITRSVMSTQEPSLSRFMNLP
jgi:hypothetical protein